MIDLAFLRRLLHRVDFPTLYPDERDREGRLRAFTEDLYLCTTELSRVKGVGRVEGTRQVFHVEDPAGLLARGSLRICELAFTSESESAILQLLENGFMYHVGREAWIAEGML